MDTRKLATIRRIDDVKPIEGADKITAYRVGGWFVVDQVGKYQVGDFVVYIEPDAWVPHDLAPFLSKGAEPKEFNGVKGQRLRTVRLRGQISQGLLLPIDIVADMCEVNDGVCVDDILNITKYEPPVPASLAGVVRGTFPSFFPKTDQERIQNIRHYQELVGTYEVTEKLEGTSFSAYVNGDDFGVCSRNLLLKEDDVSAYWQIAKKYDIESKMRRIGSNFVIQGEIVGPNVQKNIYGLKELKLYIFDIYDINSGSYLTSERRLALLDEMDLESVPVIDTVTFEHVDGDTILEIIDMSDGCSVINESVMREGLVFKKLNDPNFSFKAISPNYLLGQK